MKQNLLHVLDDCAAEIRSGMEGLNQQTAEWFYFSGQMRLLEVLIQTVGEGIYDQ